MINKVYWIYWITTAPLRH